MFSPIGLLLSWLIGLLGIAMLGGGGYLVWAWYTGAIASTTALVGGAVLLALSFAGRFPALLFFRPGPDEPVSERSTSAHRLERPDGSVLQIETTGPLDGPPLILTHGWGMNSTEWYYIRRALSDRFRVIVWDLPGLGESREPSNGEYSLEALAGHLRAVVEFAGDRPVTLAGHSIGGMIQLTYCRLFPEDLRTRVASVILVHSTYTDPVKTTTAAGLITAIKRPIVVPLAYFTRLTWPFAWAMNWLSYLNGTAHLTTAMTSFAGTQTRGQIEFSTAMPIRASPAVLMRGLLAMLRWDETETLPGIAAPVLVVAGHLDRATIPEASRKMVADIPNAELVTLTPAGHLGNLEQHDRLATAMADFVMQHRSLALAR